MTQWTLALLCCGVAIASSVMTFGKPSPLSRLVSIASTFALCAAALLALFIPPFDLSTPHGVLLIAAMFVTSGLGGGPAVLTLFSVIDKATSGQQRTDLIQNPAELRGGAWIGVFERLAVTASIVSGWPEGIALVIAIKGLGRYPELKKPHASERFIIGTFASTMWAALAAASLVV